MLLALVAKHLVEEAELRARRNEPCAKDNQDTGEARHGFAKERCSKRVLVKWAWDDVGDVELPTQHT
jgi:hypothetical protein